MPLTLDGLTVIDLTQNVAGPYCTQLLGDFGATVIKLERPGAGDDVRRFAPQWRGEAVAYLAYNRNKKSVCVDLDHPRGRDIVRRLARTADIFVHSMKPGSIESRGLGYDDLSRENPRLIYGSISGFGEKGPMRSLPGYDPLGQAWSGIISVNGHPGSPPARVVVRSSTWARACGSSAASSPPSSTAPKPARAPKSLPACSKPVSPGPRS